MLRLNKVLLFSFVLHVAFVKADDDNGKEIKDRSGLQPASSAADIASERFGPETMCAWDGNWCMFNSHCCSMNCGWDFHCKNQFDPDDVCIPDFGRCIESQQCCSGQCYGGYVCAGSTPYSPYDDRNMVVKAPNMGMAGVMPLPGGRPALG